VLEALGGFSFEALTISNKMHIIYLTRQPEGECSSPILAKKDEIAVYFLRVGRLFLIFHVQNVDDYQHKGQ